MFASFEDQELALRCAAWRRPVIRTLPCPRTADNMRVSKMAASLHTHPTAHIPTTCRN